MTDDRSPLAKLEDPMIELNTLYHSLRHMAAIMTGESPLASVLYSVANHLEHIHDTLYEHYDPLMEAAHKEQGPRVVK